MRKLTLEQLDAYAKRLSSGQVGKLYESFTGTKHVGYIAETAGIDENQFYTVYLPLTAFPNDIDESDFLIALKKIKYDDIQYKQTQTGLYAYTEHCDTYIKILELIRDLGYAGYADKVEPGYEEYLN